MQKIIILLLLLGGCIGCTYAQSPDPCSGGEVLLCKVFFKYDDAGNRTTRYEVCACGVDTHRSDSTKARRKPAAIAAQPTAQPTANGSVANNTAKIMTLYPNPATTSVKVVLNIALTQPCWLLLTNGQGIKIAELLLPAGTTEAELPLGNYAAGVYVVSLQNGAAQRFVKVE
jgi:hypothetical protein